MKPLAISVTVPLLLLICVPAAAQKESGSNACSLAKTARVSAMRAGGTSAASANFDATGYTLDIDINFIFDRLTGTTRVYGRVVDSPMLSLVLDFSDRMSVSRVLGPPFADGDTLQFTHANDALTIDFPVLTPVGQSIAVEVHYAGRPDPDAFSFGVQGGASYAYSFSQPYDAREWWPCKDHPSDKADSVRVRITVPDGMKAGSQGTLVFDAPVAPGRRLFEWHSSYPIATYLVSVAAGQYVEYTDTYTRPSALETEFGQALSLPLLHYMYDDGSTGLPSGWALTADALEVLEGWYGPYPFPVEKYGHAEWARGGAMEHQTLTSMGSFSSGVMAHELAHQWFGDMVSPRSWVDLWLSEGFATYAEYLYREARDPSQAALDLMGIMRSATLAQGTLVLEDTVSVSNMFDQTRVYKKGGAVLHMLRSVVGDAAFRNILRTFAADPAFQYGTATTADFQAVAEAEHGAPLDTFFRQWVTEGTGYPRYRVTAHLQTRGDTKAYVTVEQTQGGTDSNVGVFVMPVTIAVTTSAGEERFTVMNTRRRQPFTLDVTGIPSAVTFDPDYDLLREADPFVATATMATTPVFETVVPNPLGRVGEVRVVLPDDAEVAVELYDVAGRFVREVTRVGGAGPHRLDFNTGGLPSGVYFLRLDGPGGTDTRKVTIVR